MRAPASPLTTVAESCSGAHLRPSPGVSEACMYWMCAPHALPLESAATRVAVESCHRFAADLEQWHDRGSFEGACERRGVDGKVRCARRCRTRHDFVGNDLGSDDRAGLRTRQASLMRERKKNTIGRQARAALCRCSW